MELPLLLCGPILRRVEPRRICVWLATSRRALVRAEVLTTAGETLATSHPESGGTVQSIGLGKQLFVHLLEVRPETGHALPADEVLLYEVRVEGEVLAADGPLGEGVDLRYGDLRLPSFLIPSRTNRILHGSCRKLHTAKPDGHGEPLDRLALGDRVVSGCYDSPGDRPTALFLTGDQIYADSVGAPLLAALTHLAHSLMGRCEPLPGVEDTDRHSLFARQTWVDRAGFTTEEGDNHLLSFGEYAAMYLAAWGLPIDLPQWQTVRDRIPAGVSAERLGELASRYERERGALIAFQRTLPRVRRLLANVPTYMIFDDHEVSDDWNINRRWRRAVRRDDLGRRVVANALAAYWAFQSWGNYPEGHSSRLIDAVQAHLNEPALTGARASRFEERLWNKQGWGYAVPGSPPVLVLDTRTQRAFDSARGAARLMDRYGLSWLRTAWADLTESAEAQLGDHPPLVVVSPTPVYGFEPIQQLQKFAGAFGRIPEKVDFESWVANRDGFGRLMVTLASDLSPRWVLVLSGDVHYSFTTRARFQVGTDALELWQATSSPLRNHAAGTRLASRLSGRSRRIERRFGWRDPDETPLYWRVLRPLIDLSVRMDLVDPDPAKRPIWKDRVESLSPDVASNLLLEDNNLGLVAFQDDRPTTHELCIPDGDGFTAIRFHF